MEKRNHRRWTTLKGAMEYSTMGRNKTIELAEKASAISKFGRRNVYDLDAIDDYLEKQRRM